MGFENVQYDSFDQLRMLFVYSVMTPYYSEETVFSKSDLEQENEDGISIIFYLQKIYPGIWLGLIFFIHDSNMYDFISIF